MRFLGLWVNNAIFVFGQAAIGQVVKFGTDVAAGCQSSREGLCLVGVVHTFRGVSRTRRASGSSSCVSPSARALGGSLPAYAHYSQLPSPFRRKPMSAQESLTENAGFFHRLKMTYSSTSIRLMVQASWIHFQLSLARPSWPMYKPASSLACPCETSVPPLTFPRKSDAFA